MVGSRMCRGEFSVWAKRAGTMSAGLMLAIAVWAIGAGTALADWPSYRGGPSQNMNRAVDLGTNPTQIWASIESMRSEPCVVAVGKSAFTIATPKADFGAQRLFRIDLATGKTAWSTFAFEASQQASCPAADSSRVYFAAGPVLEAVDIVGGELAWESELGGEVGKPMTNEGIVYASSSKTIFALDAGDGSVVWEAPAEPSGRPPLLVGGAIVNVGNEMMSAYDAVTGEALWSIEGQVLDAIGIGDSVVLSYAEEFVIALDALNGSLEWAYEVPPLTAARKLVADETTVYALTPSTDFHFQVNHLIALDLKTGATKYVRKFEPVESCCGTTAAYPPFVKFGSTLYNHYRYFDAATGAAPGGESDRTHKVFYDGSGCSNEQDSMFAHVNSTIVVWKNLCSRSVLVAREGEPEPEGPGPVALIDPAAEAFTGSRPQFGWKVGYPSVVSHYELVIDGAIFAEVSSGEVPVHLTPEEDLSEGSHTWSVVVVDKGGGRTESETRGFTVDTLAPAPFALLKPQDGSATDAKPEFTWEAAVDVGPAGLDRYELIIAGEVSAKVPAGSESTVAPFELSQGAHTWSVVAVDRAGNPRGTETRSFFVDITGPQGIELIEPEPGASTGPRPQFRWYPATDYETSVDHYELILDKAPYAEVPAGKEGEVLSFTPSEDLSVGSHTWSVRPFDVAGNFKESETRSFTVDSSPPAPPILNSPGEGALVGARPEFDWEASEDPDLAYYELIVDGEALIAKESSHTMAFDLGDGLHTWSVVAVDNQGNRAESESRSFTVDGASPTPFSLLEPADGAITGFQVEFSWEAASDVGAAGLDHYELMLNGEQLADIPAGTEFFAENGEHVLAGLNTWSVSAIDKVGNRQESATRSFIVATPPTAALSAPEMALTETPVTFDASASTPPPGGTIVKYEWDLNGDGIFERDTGEAAATVRTYANVKDIVVSVRVSSNLGTDAIASAPISVRLAPPPGHLGVTINEGAEFTNKRNVTISPVWPVFALTALVSNDGGFREAEEVPVATGIKWKLDSAGGERLPETVYVRFQGGESGRETYQDDIILDLVKPKVLTATISAERTLLGISARDGISGVAAIQIAANSENSTGWRPFKRRIHTPRGSKRVFVRVRDRAGNKSRWRRATVRGRRSP